MFQLMLGVRRVSGCVCGSGTSPHPTRHVGCVHSFSFVLGACCDNRVRVAAAHVTSGACTRSALCWACVARPTRRSGLHMLESSSNYATFPPTKCFEVLTFWIPILTLA